MLRAQQAMWEAMVTQLTQVNELMDSSCTSLSAEFISIANNVQQAQGAISDAKPESLAHAQELLSQVARSVSQVILHMQFQDRVSQNLVIAMNLMRLVSEHTNAMANGSASKANPTALVPYMDLMKLGEIKQKFVAELIARGLITDGAEVGYTSQAEGAGSADDDIELF